MVARLCFLRYESHSKPGLQSAAWPVNKNTAKKQGDRFLFSTMRIITFATRFIKTKNRNQWLKKSK